MLPPLTAVQYCLRARDTAVGATHPFPYFSFSISSMRTSNHKLKTSVIDLYCLLKIRTLEVQTYKKCEINLSI
jgi:hypothetical protein